MNDIFDEVDEILNEDINNKETTPQETVESNFNESELQDIMAEIESLEQEFDSESVQLSEPTVAPLKKTKLQEEIEQEIDMSKEENVEHEEKVAAPIAALTKVLPMEKKSTSTNQNLSSSEISFEASGQMNLNLTFKIGNESAKLSIDPVMGLVVTMNGVSLCINEEEGCKVTMENGVKFTIPLTSSTTTLKKKAA